MHGVSVLVTHMFSTSSPGQLILCMEEQHFRITRQGPQVADTRLQDEHAPLLTSAHDILGM